jgi:transcriptional regulator with XRE-family HTH domain
MTGKQLKAIRERLGLSQEQFAARLKLSRVSVTRMEYGSQVIKPSMAYFVELVAKEAGVESPDAKRGRGDAQGKQAHAKTAKAAARQVRKAVPLSAKRR